MEKIHKCLDCGKAVLRLETEKESGLCVRCYCETVSWSKINFDDYAMLKGINRSITKEFSIKSAWQIANFDLLPVNSLHKVIQ